MSQSELTFEPDIEQQYRARLQAASQRRDTERLRSVALGVVLLDRPVRLGDMALTYGAQHGKQV